MGRSSSIWSDTIRLVDRSEDSKSLKSNLSLESRQQSWWSRNTTGWRFGIWSCAASATVVFFINLISTIWAATKAGGFTNGRGVLYNGDCTKIRPLNVGIHLAINILSTILLSASNYSMQCLSAPTRKDVDKAHAKGSWLDIGVPSVRNLTRISKKRTLIWWALGLSSLPLHLFYNSAVFSSISANDYWVIQVHEGAVEQNAPKVKLDSTTVIQDPRSVNYTDSDPIGMQMEGTVEAIKSAENAAQTLQQKALDGKLQRLDNKACIAAYAQAFQTTRGSLLLIIANNATTNVTQITDTAYSAVFHTQDFNDEWDNERHDSPYCVPDPYRWICGNGMPMSHLWSIPSNSSYWKNGSYSRSNYMDDYLQHDNHECADSCDSRMPSADSWAPFNQTVEYCLSETTEEHCKLQFSVQIAILVIVLNFTKAALMFYFVLTVKEAPLMTMGDAVASFLERTDQTTEGMCLVTREEIKRATRPNRVWDYGYRRVIGFPKGPRPYFAVRKAWAAAVSKTRWAICMALFLICIIVVGILLGMAVGSIVGAKDFNTLMKLGVGAITPKTLISGWDVPSQGASGLIGNVLVANAPQPILSFIYFSINGLFTSMLLAAEWNRFSRRRKGLRISGIPQGAQRTSYTLQLPYRIALPLMIISGLLHWLVSQSIFLVTVEAYSLEIEDNAVRYHNTHGDYMTCGFSPAAMMAVLIVGVLLIGFAIGIGLRRFKTTMPIAASCSAAISAACHPGKGREDEDAAFKPVMWGVIRDSSMDANGHRFGHCGFSSEEVDPPEVARPYAGYWDFEKME